MRNKSLEDTHPGELPPTWRSCPPYPLPPWRHSVGWRGCVCPLCLQKASYSLYIQKTLLNLVLSPYPMLCQPLFPHHSPMFSLSSLLLSPFFSFSLPSFSNTGSRTGEARRQSELSTPTNLPSEVTTSSCMGRPCGETA